MTQWESVVAPCTYSKVTRQWLANPDPKKKRKGEIFHVCEKLTNYKPRTTATGQQEAFRVKTLVEI